MRILPRKRQQKIKAHLRFDQSNNEWYVKLSNGKSLSDLAALHMRLELPKKTIQAVRDLGETAYQLNTSTWR
jgi:hypothetical protein